MRSVKYSFAFLALLLAMAAFFSCMGVLAVEMNISPTAVEFGPVLRGSWGNPAAESVTLNVVSTAHNYNISLAGSELVGLTDPGAAVIDVGQISYRVDDTDTWVKLAAVEEIAVHAAKATTPEGYDHTFDFVLDVPAEAVAQDYGGTITFDISTLTLLEVKVRALPLEGGTVSGSGGYLPGENITVNAKPHQGYCFVNWTEGGEVISTKATYTFTAVADRDLTANFALIPVGITADPGVQPQWSNISEVDLNFSPAEILLRQRFAWADSSAPPEVGWSDWGSLPERAVLLPAEGEWYLHVEAESVAGCRSADCFGPYLFDAQAPQVTFSVPGSPIYVRSQPVRVTVTDNLSGVLYSRYQWSTSALSPAGDWLDFDSGDELPSPAGATGNYYLHVRAEDAAGNRIEAASSVFRLDNTPPQISFSAEGNRVYAQKQSTVVTVNDVHSGVASRLYQWSDSAETPTGGSWTAFANGALIESPVGQTGDYYLHIRALDEAGNTADLCSNVFRLDNTAPTAPDIELSATGWGKSAVTVTVSGGSDVHSGIAGYQYKLDSGGWVEYSEPFEIIDEGVVTVYARAVDNAGNIGPADVMEVKVDRSAPLVVFQPDGNFVYAKTHSTKVVVSDSLSGVKESFYQWADSEETPANGNWTAFTSGSTISPPPGLTGDYYLHIRAEDNAGNTTNSCSGVFKLDNTPPVAPVLNLDESWTNGDRSFTVSGGSDEHSGFVRQYRIGGGEWVTGDSGTVTTEGQTVVYARTEDGAGNWSTTVSRTAKIDKTPPTGSININSGASYAEPYKAVTLNLSATDSGGSGLTQMRFRDAGGTWTVWESYASSKSWTLPTSPLNGTKSVEVQYRDGAGNISTTYSKSIKVLALYWNGVVVPWIEGETHGGGNSTQEIAASDGDGVHMYLYGCYYGVSSGERTYVTGNSYSFSDVSRIRITWKQNAGNKHGQSVLAVSTDQMGNNVTYDKRILKEGDFDYMTESLDVGDLNGSYYIRVHAKRKTGVGSRDSKVRAYRVWVE